MFSDKLKNLLPRSFTSNNNEESFFDRAVSMISSARRTTPENTTAEFDSYLQSLPTEELRIIKNYKPRSSRTASLKPQLVTNCYRNVPKVFFKENQVIIEQMFTRNRKQASDKTSRMQQYLDEVEICLFNQISSRFDQILSVLRTIESLECVVTYNSERLAQVRSSNIQLAKTASQRHLKIVSLLRRQERMKKVIEKLAEIKIYSSFVGKDMSETSDLRKVHSQYYEQINEIRMRRELYFQLEATKNFEEKVEELQNNLKKSYSDTINDSFFKYAVEIFIYDSNFWDRKFVGKVIFEEDQPEADGTVILDESMLFEEEVGGFNIKISEERERDIVDNLVSGWRDGEYAIGNLKAAFDKFVKEKHLRYLSDCRNFCFQAYLREDREKIENPNIGNLMQHMNIFFCTKAFIYYADMYRTMLTRSFSLVNKIVLAMIRVTRETLTIEEKQKVAGVIDGLLSILAFIFKLAYQKILQVFKLKIVYDQMELHEFKQLINLYETEQDFIIKHIKRYTDIKGEDTFLAPILQASLSKIDFDQVTQAKQEKVLSFLEKTHEFILKNQLRESLENEVWKAEDIPTFYYDSLHYLITGESLNLRRNKNHTIRHNMSTNNFESSVFIDRMGKEVSMLGESKVIGNFRIIRNQIIIDSTIYKVTTTLLLILQIIEDYMHLSQFYPFTREQVGVKIFELIRAYHTESHKLIVKGLAVKLGKIKSKTITAKHLALNSLCLAFILYIIKCIRDRVPLHEQAKMKEDLQEHYQSIVNKLGSILGGKINQALPDINFSAVPSKGTESIVNSTKILHDILADFYQKDTLAEIFVRQNVQVYLNQVKSLEVTSKMQAESLKDDINFYFHELIFLEGLIDNFEGLRLQGEDIIRVKFQEL